MFMKKNITTLSIVILTILISVWIGFNVGKNYQNNLITKSEKHQSGYLYISPLLECIDANKLTYRHSLLKKRLEEQIKDQISSRQINTASVYFRDLNNGPWLSINGGEKFSPASLLKVPLMIAYFKEFEKTPELMDKKIIITKNSSKIIQQNFVPIKKVETGQEYSFSELVERMIKYSDNLAADTLLENINMSDLERIYEDLGISVPTMDHPENFMSIIDYSSFFRILYNSSYLSREMSEKALSIMADINFIGGIKGRLPFNVPVAHKFGERIFNDQKQLHDCGIVYLEEKNYLICIMTRGESFTQMSGAISDLSRTVFDHIYTAEK
jgi:beta-lactamase class A